MYRISLLFVIWLASLAIAHAATVAADSSSSVSAKEHQRPDLTSSSKLSIASSKKNCKGGSCMDEDKDDKKIHQLKQVDDPTEPYDPICPENYVLTGRRCVLDASAPSSVPATAVPARCPRKFTLVDGDCVRGTAIVSPRCPRRSRLVEDSCLSCERGQRLTIDGTCMLARIVRPMCNPGDRMRRFLCYPRVWLILVVTVLFYPQCWDDVLFSPLGKFGKPH